MDSGSESDAPKALVLPELKKGKVDRHDRLFDRLLAPVRQTAECISDFKFRGVGAPPRVARPERSEQLPVIPSEPRKASQWQAKTARPRLASRRLMKAGEVPKPRQRAGSTAAEAAFITEVLGADRVVVRGDDIAAELVGRNEELVEFAKHRLDSRIQATQTSRKKAVQWRQQQIERETLFRTRCRASIIVHRPDYAGAREKPSSITTKGHGNQALILKGISCDTGILNVTFCPLMDQAKEPEVHDEEGPAAEPLPTPNEEAPVQSEQSDKGPPRVLQSKKSMKSLASLEPDTIERLMDFSDLQEEIKMKVKENKAVLDDEAPAATRRRRREINKKLRELKRKYKDKMTAVVEGKDPMESRPTLQRAMTMEGMPTVSKAYLSLVSPSDEKTYRDVLRRYTDTDAIDQSDLRQFLENVGFKPRNKAERELMNNLLRNLDTLDVKFELLFQEIIPNIRLGFAEIRSADLSKRFHAADVDKSGTLSMIELLQILRWSGYFPRLNQMIQTVTEVIPETAELLQQSSFTAFLEKDILSLPQFHILAPLLEERAESDFVQRRQEIAETMDLDEHTERLWGFALVDLQDVFLRRAKHDLLPFPSLLHLALDCGLVQHRGSGFREKLRSIAAEEVAPQLVEEGLDLNDPIAVERAHFDFRQVLRIMTQIREIENDLIADVFAAADTDDTNGLSVEECIECLDNCGIKASGKQSQEMIPKLVEEFDEDGSGELDLEEYLEFAKFVADRMRKMQHVSNMDMAQRVGYGEEEYLRFWDAFVGADDNLDSMLEEEELLHAVWQARPEIDIAAGDVRAILKDQGIGYWKQEIRLTMYDFLLIMKDVDQLGTWRTLGQDKGVEKELVDSFIGLWRSLARNIKEDNVSVKELQRAVKTLPGAPVKLARIRLLQQMGIEAIDFASFVQVMKTKNSELGDGLDIAESDFSGPLSPHEFMSPMITPSAPVRPAASIRRGERQMMEDDPV